MYICLWPFNSGRSLRLLLRPTNEQLVIYRVNTHLNTTFLGWPDFGLTPIQGAPSRVGSGREQRNRLSQNWGRFWLNRRNREKRSGEGLYRRQKIDLYFFDLLSVSGNSKHFSKKCKKKIFLELWKKKFSKKNFPKFFFRKMLRIAWNTK